jgi:hypothetical protein
MKKIISRNDAKSAGFVFANSGKTMTEYDQMQEQKQRILEREDRRVFDAAMAALRTGAPGLSEATREAVARNISLRLASPAPSNSSKT